MASGKISLWMGPLLFFPLVLLSGYFLWIHEESVEPPVITPVEKIIRFSYTLSNQSSELVDPFDFISYAPVNREVYQEIQFIDSSHEYVLSGEGAAGNITLNMARIPPYGSRLINLTMGVQVYDGPKYEPIDSDLYLKSEDYIEVDDPAIKRLAARLANEASDIPRNAYQWVRNNVEDAGYIAQNKGARYAIGERRGDCTEYMYAFIALARANGIPARGVSGFVVENDTAMVASSDYHNWAEFYDGEKWILVDPYKGVFDDQYGNYVAFRLIGGAGNYSGSARRFLAVDERVSVRL